MANTTTNDIMVALLGITYSGTSNTKERRIQLHDTDFEDFTDYPLIVIVSGNEDIDGLADRQTESMFRPEVHLFVEDTTPTLIEGWRNDIRTAIMSSLTLWNLVTSVMINTILLDEPDEKKIQHLTFNLEIKFDTDYTIA